MQGVISSPHLATKILFNALLRWSLYLSMCVTALASESLDAPGCHITFSIKPILVDMEGGRYVGPILPAALADVLHETDGRGGGSSGTTANKRKASTTEGDSRMQVRYNAHLTALALRYRENSCSILGGTVLLALNRRRWNSRHPTDPPTWAILPVANLPIWGSATPQESATEECG